MPNLWPLIKGCMSNEEWCSFSVSFESFLEAWGCKSTQNWTENSHFSFPSQEISPLGDTAALYSYVNTQTHTIAKMIMPQYKCLHTHINRLFYGLYKQPLIINAPRSPLPLLLHHLHLPFTPLAFIPSLNPQRFMGYLIKPHEVGDTETNIDI